MRRKATVHHELVRRNGRIEVKRFSQKGYDHYHIRIYIEADLDKIEYVAYELHPTFRRPLRASKDLKSNFAIDFWTWGEFELAATVYYKSGQIEELTYNLEYSDELSSDDSEYVYVKP